MALPAPSTPVTTAPALMSSKLHMMGHVTSRVDNMVRDANMVKKELGHSFAPSLFQLQTSNTGIDIPQRLVNGPKLLIIDMLLDNSSHRILYMEKGSISTAGLRIRERVPRGKCSHLSIWRPMLKSPTTNSAAFNRWRSEKFPLLSFLQFFRLFGRRIEHL